jgi:hypothetical protein
MKKNVNIKDFMEAVKFKIDEGCKHQWDCFGPDACMIGWNKEDNSASAGIVYDSKIGLVYSMEVWDNLNDKVYRWIRPEFTRKVKKEYASRGFKFSIAVDPIKYIETSPSNILKKLDTAFKRKKLKKKSFLWR